MARRENPGASRHLIPAGLRVALTMVLITACGDGTPTDPDPVLTEIRVTPAATTITALGETVALTAVAVDDAGAVMTGIVFTWSSSREAVATVANTGVVLAAGGGTATISASSGGVTGTAMITVSQTVDQVVVTPGSSSLASLGATVELAAEGRDAGGSPVPGLAFTWASSDEATATVSSTGEVTAVANGTATVTATASGVSGDAEVVVAQVVATVAVSPAEATVEVGADTSLEAEALDALGEAVAAATFAWASEDEAIALVDEDGVVTGVTAGEVDVTATADGIEGRSAITVTVDPIPPQDATYETAANTELVAGAYAPPSTPHVHAADNVLSATPGASVTSLDPITTTEGGTAQLEADGDLSYRPPAGFTGEDTFDFTVEGGLAATVTVDVVGPVVWYVDNRASGGGSGRSHDPFATLAAAEGASTADETIFVHAGDGTTTGHDAGITLQSGQSLVGEAMGLAHASFGELVLPGSRPVLTNGAGAAVTMADGSLVAGFDIGDASGPGISATTVTGGQLDELAITASLDAAIVLTDVSGVWNSSDLHIEASAAAGAVVVSGGDPDLTLRLAGSTLDNAPGGGHALEITGTTGGFVRVEGGEIHEQGAGIHIEETAGDVEILSFLDVDNTSDSGIRVVGSSGPVTFADVDVTTTGQMGIQVGATTAPVDITGQVFTTDDYGFYATPDAPVNATFSSFIVDNDGTGTRSRGLLMSGNPGIVEIDFLDIFVGEGYDISTGLEHIDASGGVLRILDPTSRIVVPDGSAFSIVAGAAFGNPENYRVEATLGTIEAAGSARSYSGASLGLLGTDGYVTVLDGSITDAGTAVRVGFGGSVDLTFGGTISESIVSGTAILVSDQVGGTVTFEGDVESTGTGIRITDNAAPTTVRFTGGLDLQTGATDAFVASGGGTVEVTGTGNTIVTTTGQGVRITDTEIGTAGVTFQSVSVDGAIIGIQLEETGDVGGFTVSGTGAPASGGVIQNTTGVGIHAEGTQDISLSWMELTATLGGLYTTNVGALTLADVDVNASGADALEVNAAGVVSLTDVFVDTPVGAGFRASALLDGFTFDNVTVQNAGSRGLAVDGYEGTAQISNSLFDGNSGNNFVQTATGSFDLTVLDTSFDDNVTATGEDGATGLWTRAAGTAEGTVELSGVTASGNANNGLVIEAQGTAQLEAVVDGVTLDLNDFWGLELLVEGQAVLEVAVANPSTITNNTSGGVRAFAESLGLLAFELSDAVIDANPGGGVSMVNFESSVLLFDVHDNTITNPGSGVIALSESGPAGVLEGFVRNNTISGGPRAVFASSQSTGTATIAVSDNTVSSFANAVYGWMIGLDGATLDLTVTGNDVTGAPAGGPPIALEADTGDPGNAGGTMCVNVQGNEGGLDGEIGLSLSQGDMVTFLIERLLGGAGSTSDPFDVTDHLATENPDLFDGVSATLDSPVTGVPDGTCVVPVF